MNSHTPLHWQDEWLLGIESLDRDHQTMVRLINDLIADEEQGAPPLGERLDRLLAHLRRHFEAEEAFLRTIGYPDYCAHRQEHLMELVEFTQLRQDVERSEAPRLDLQSYNEIKYWFLNHAVLVDQLFARYYRHYLSTHPAPDESRAVEIPRCDPLE